MGNRKKSGYLIDDAVRHMITDVIFVHFKQFVSSDGNEEFGSKWQKAVCRNVSMAEEDLRRFWEAQKGNQIARKILNCTSERAEKVNETLTKLFLPQELLRAGVW